MENLQLYASTTYKNQADIWKSLKQDNLIIFTPPELEENAKPTQKEMWRICAKNNIKLKELLQANHDALHEVVL